MPENQITAWRQSLQAQLAIETDHDKIDLILDDLDMLAGL